MSKPRKLKLYLLVLPFVFLLNASGAMGQGGCINVPTLPGTVKDIEGFRGNPTLYASSDAVDRNDYVEAWVDSGGLACPPYDWSVSGTGFYFDGTEGSTEAKTKGDLEKLQLWADDTACGAAVITVTDACSQKATASVREPYNGRWGNPVEEEQCSYYTRPDGCAYCTCVDTFVIGGYKYQNIWIGDKACGMTEETCGPYPGGEDLTGDPCYVVGYYTPAYCNTLYRRKMWEWQCN